MKKIWILNHYIIPPQIEVGHRHNKFAKYLVRKGYQVTLFHASSIHNTEINLIQDNRPFQIDETDQGTYIAVKTRDYTGNGRSRLFNMLDYFRGLFRVTKQVIQTDGKPEIVYASSVHLLTCVAGILIAKKIGVKCVVEVRDLWPLSVVEMGRLREGQLITKLLYRLEKWVYRRADRLIFTMPGGAQYVKDQGWTDVVAPSKISNINNGIDLEVYDRQRAENIFADDDLDSDCYYKIVYTGAVRAFNGLDNLLDVAKLLRDSQVGARTIRFIIFGEGTYREELEARCAKEEIDNIVFKGPVNKSYIPNILSKADLTLLNYNTEVGVFKYGGSQNKLFEYLAAGKPIISNIKMNYDVIEPNQCGVCVDGGSIEEVKNAILEIANAGPGLYLKYCENARKTALDYDFALLTDRLERILLDAAEEKN